MDQAELYKQTSLLHWFPVVQELEIRHPKTVVIEKSREMPLRELCKIIDGETPIGWKELIKCSRDYAKQEVRKVTGASSYTRRPLYMFS